jgi:hypothetical protein
MAKDPAPFLLKFWWLPPALLVLAAVIAAWIYRERPLVLGSFQDSLLQSTASLEIGLGEPPAQRVEYRTRVTIESQGQRSESTIHHVAEHLGGGWIRRSDHWHDGGASRSTYQEQYLIYRNVLQVFQKHRVMAPFVHDLLAEFGWLDNSTTAQAVAMTGEFPRGEDSSMSVRQSRVAPTDSQTLVPKRVPYERHIECRRDGVIEGSTLGSALSGQMVRVSCRSMRSDLSGESINVYVWEPKARIFLLVQAQQPMPLGGTETQTRRIEALSIVP